MIAATILSLSSLIANVAPTGDYLVDERKTIYIAPKSIVWSNTTGDASIKNVDCLLTLGDGQANLGADKYCNIKTRKEGTASILFDFGKEIQGHVQLTTGGGEPRVIPVNVRYGESVSEAMEGITPENGSTNDHAIRDFKLSLPFFGTANGGESGFRFVRLDFETPEINLLLKDVRAAVTFRDIPYLGSFRSSDSRLDSIWQTGAYTVHLNMQDYVWDGVKRDRLVWIGDMHPEVLTIYNVFGYNPVVPKSLDLIRDTTPMPHWMNGMCSYSLWWILIHHDWYMMNGDADYLAQQKPYLEQLSRFILGQVDNDGHEHLTGATRFLDWPTSEDKESIDLGLHAMVAMALDASSSMLRTMGNKQLADSCANTSRLMRKTAPKSNSVKQVSALLSLADMMRAEKGAKEILRDGAKDFTSFYGYYMLEALAKAGKYDEAMDIIKQFWGGMLDLGATTFWEDFNIDWLDNAGRIDEMPQEGKVDVHKSYGNYCYSKLRHSLCHGWASGPTSWLSRHVLGVEIVEPGFKAIRINPHLGSLDHVSGTIPTPHGVISVEHKRDSKGHVRTTYSVPEGIKVLK